VNTAQRSSMRLLLTALVVAFELAHLGWELFHGGVDSHHILHRPDLPAISNWWGLVVLPGLAWFLSGRILSRTVRPSQAAGRLLHLPPRVLPRFLSSLLFGAVLAATFASGHETATSYLFLSMFPMALVFPAYLGEYVLGFVLGMTVTFGAVLPVVVALVFAGISAVLRFSLAKLFTLVRAASMRS